MDNQAPMHNLFADYQTSKLLKEHLGFDEICIAWYTDHAENKESIQQMTFDMHMYFDDNDIKNSEVDEGVYCASLWQQIEEWLWEKNGRIWIDVYRHNGEYFFYIHQQGKILLLSTTIFNSPITASTEGIKAAVKWLYNEQEKLNKK